MHDAAVTFYKEEPVSFPYSGTILSFNKPLSFGYVELDKPLLEPPPTQMVLSFPAREEQAESAVGFFDLKPFKPERWVRRGTRIKGRAIRRKDFYQILSLEREQTAAATPQGFWARLWAQLVA